MKKTAILATAVAAIMAGTAVADTTVYGRARMALQLNDASTGVINGSSRFGFKGSEDLGNGMAAIYHFELGYDADNDQDPAGPVDNRIGLVGLKGDFGTFAMGRAWGPSYNLVEAVYDPFNIAGVTYALGGRWDDVLFYGNSFGDVQFQAAVVSRSDLGDELVDGTNVAVSLPVGPVTIGAAFLSLEDTVTGGDSESGTAISVEYKMDGIRAYLGLSSAEDVVGGDNYTVIGADIGMGSGTVLVRFEAADNLDDDRISAGYHHNMSKRTQAFVELQTEGDGFGADAQWIGLKHNF
jgi:predicted porin